MPPQRKPPSHGESKSPPFINVTRASNAQNQIADDSGLKTPPHNPPLDPTSFNTPIAARNINAQSSDSGNLETRRDRILQDIGPIHEYGADTLLNYCYPRIASLTLPTTDMLKKAKILDGNGRWCLFPTDPRESRLNKDNYFQNFVPLCEAICKLPCFTSADGQKHAKEPLSDLKAEPNKAPLSARNYNHRPDFYFLLKNKRSVDVDSGSGKSASWLDILCCGEVKKGITKADVKDVGVSVSYSVDTP